MLVQPTESASMLTAINDDHWLFVVVRASSALVRARMPGATPRLTIASIGAAQARFLRFQECHARPGYASRAHSESFVVAAFSSKQGSVGMRFAQESPLITSAATWGSDL